jgi:hypothetical protein
MANAPPLPGEKEGQQLPLAGDWIEDAPSPRGREGFGVCAKSDGPQLAFGARGNYQGRSAAMVLVKASRRSRLWLTLTSR